MQDMTELLIFLFTALAFSFLCSVLEATLMSTPISYITMREEEGYKPATRMKAYKTNPSRPIAAILSLNTIANTIGAAGVGRQATIIFGSEWFGLVSVLMTVMIAYSRIEDLIAPQESISPTAAGMNIIGITAIRNALVSRISRTLTTFNSSAVNSSTIP